MILRYNLGQAVFQEFDEFFFAGISGGRETPPT